MPAHEEADSATSTARFTASNSSTLSQQGHLTVLLSRLPATDMISPKYEVTLGSPQLGQLACAQKKKKTLGDGSKYRHDTVRNGGECMLAHAT